MNTFEIYRNAQAEGEKCWCWRFLDATGALVASSKGAFAKDGVDGVRIGIKRFIDAAKGAPIMALPDSDVAKATKTRIEYKKGGDDVIDWHLKTGNDEILATGKFKVGETEIDVDVYLKDVCKKIGDSKIEWEVKTDDPAHDAKTVDSTTTRGLAGS